MDGMATTRTEATEATEAPQAGRAGERTAQVLRVGAGALAGGYAFLVSLACGQLVAVALGLSCAVPGLSSFAGGVLTLGAATASQEAARAAGRSRRGSPFVLLESMEARAWGVAGILAVFKAMGVAGVDNETCVAAKMGDDVQNHEAEGAETAREVEEQQVREEEQEAEKDGKTSTGTAEAIKAEEIDRNMQSGAGQAKPPGPDLGFPGSPRSGFSPLSPRSGHYSTGQRDGLQRMTEDSTFISGVVWDLVLMLMTWLYVSATAVFGFKVLGKNFVSGSRAKLFSWIVAVGDIVLAFLIFSAFSTTASSAQALRGLSKLMDELVFGGLAGDVSFGISKAGAAAAFTFLTWATFLYSACVGVAILKGSPYLAPLNVDGETAGDGSVGSPLSSPRQGVENDDISRTVAEV
ncbi:Hypothetical Protein FCC1311_007892 [Hondaea fermentalgiana]|uniref:Uncharacterized protein n=1 Tax=Hondaea fermentalgiana TaxID=2315210 RepID=A0A2R5G0N9_9STRA|nr:Hypothetical Protein FCC1311_007892 [Hondaea fermentalgiana]|eukprot:GBG24570.1 Hypothetical Protein FCC1311_007892 [Hondaea fermentalgiana]